MKVKSRILKSINGKSNRGPYEPISDAEIKSAIDAGLAKRKARKVSLTDRGYIQLREFKETEHKRYIEEGDAYDEGQEKIIQRIEKGESVTKEELNKFNLGDSEIAKKAIIVKGKKMSLKKIKKKGIFTLKDEITTLEIHKHNPDLENLQFVSRGLAVAEVTKLRYDGAMSRISIELGTDGCVAVSTDGNRLHWVDLVCGYRPGLYKVIKNTKILMVLEFDSEVTTFPDWKGVIPDKSKTKINISKNTSAAYTAIVRAMNSNVTIDFELFKDLGEHGFTVYVSEEDIVPVLFDGGTKHAAIMPIRL